VWYPRLFDRRTHGAWVEAGKPTAIKSAKEFAHEIISKHTPKTLSAVTLDTLSGIIAEADSRASISTKYAKK
jgi:trimethylamine:corrinoid methyltransferase-like protein